LDGAARSGPAVIAPTIAPTIRGHGHLAGSGDLPRGRSRLRRL